MKDLDQNNPDEASESTSASANGSTNEPEAIITGDTQTQVRRSSRLKHIPKYLEAY